jgi:predicted transcriptional regulator
MKLMIGFRASREFREFLQEMARKENRSLSNFIINAILTYLKEHHGVEWNGEDLSATSRGPTP